MLRKIRKVFASLGISAFLGTADQPAAGWILRIHIKGTKAIAEKKKKKIRINQFTEALMVYFFKLFFSQNDLLRYTSFDGERNSRPTCAFMVTVAWLEAGLFADACFTSTLFNSVSMTHISRLTGPLPLSLYANTEIIDLFTDGATTLLRKVSICPHFIFLVHDPADLLCQRPQKSTR